MDSRFLLLVGCPDSQSACSAITACSTRASGTNDSRGNKCILLWVLEPVLLGCHFLFILLFDLAELPHMPLVELVSPSQGFGVVRIASEHMLDTFLSGVIFGLSFGSLRFCSLLDC